MRLQDKGIRRGVWVLAAGLLVALGLGVWGAWALTDHRRSHDRSHRELDADGVAAQRRGRLRRRGSNEPRTRGGEASFDAGVAAEDPQMLAFERSWTHVGDAGTGAGPEFAPTTHLGRVRSTSGESPIAAGARCEVRLLPVLTSLFNCVVRVACDGVVLYPHEGQAAGYAPCDVSRGMAVSAADEGVTEADGDPTLMIDVAARHVRVTDRGAGVRTFEADIDLLRPI